MAKAFNLRLNWDRHNYRDSSIYDPSAIYCAPDIQLAVVGSNGHHTLFQSRTKEEVCETALKRLVEGVDFSVIPVALDAISFTESQEIGMRGCETTILGEVEIQGVRVVCNTRISQQAYMQADRARLAEVVAKSMTAKLQETIEEKIKRRMMPEDGAPVRKGKITSRKCPRPQ